MRDISRADVIELARQIQETAERERSEALEAEARVHMAERYLHRNGETEPPTVGGWFGVEFMDYDKPVRTVALLSEDRLGVRESQTGVRVDGGRYKGARWWGPWDPWNEEDSHA